MIVDENTFSDSGLFCYFLPIDTNEVNIEARLARHAKLTHGAMPSESAIEPVKRTLLSKCLSSKKKSHTGSQNIALSKLFKRIVSISMAFFVISSLGPLYYFTEGQEGYDGDYFVDVTEGETDTILEQMITSDGFLLKPALNDSVGDRSNAKEIFVYQVEPGDTLSSLAQRFGIKKETLVMENNLWNANSLKTGMTLKILPVDGVSHTVQKGDTISSIAKKFKVEEEVILKQNQLEKGAVLAANSTLIIKGGIKEVIAPQPTYVARANGAAGKARAGGGGPSTPAPNYSGTATGRLIWPTLGSARLTQKYSRGHQALDIGNRAHGPIYAAASGIVVKAEHSGWNGGYGQVVIIDHGNGMRTLYGHNDKVYVEVGDKVEQGKTIAWMGNTGNVRGPTGIHVHFEVIINGTKYDPMGFF